MATAILLQEAKEATNAASASSALAAEKIAAYLALPPVETEAEKLAREQREREAAEKAATEKAEKEAAEKAAKEKAEREAKEKAEKEAAEPKATWRGYSATSPMPATSPPYLPSAFINQRVPAVPAVLPNSAPMCVFVSPSDVWTDGGYDHPAYFASASDPLVEITGVKYGSWANGMKIRCPLVAKSAPGSDAHMSVIQPNGEEFDFWAVSGKGPVNGKITAGGAGFAFNFATSSGVSERTDGATASGFNNLTGVVRPEELAAGYIPHGLFIPCSVTKSGSHKAPAKGGDGTSGDPNSPQQGQRFYLAYTDAEIAAANWPRWKKTIITAMAHYGLWCGDSGGGFVKFWGQQSYTSYGLPQPYDFLKADGGTSGAVGLGGACLILHLKEGVDWTRLRAIAWP